MDGFNTTLNQGGNGGGGGGAAAKLAVSITYAALKALRDGGNLVPGTWYRITDYHTTVSPLITDVRSADHQFDVIVRADDASHLNENGYAAHHEGDEYFAACKLEAWELQYRLDNDNWSRVAGTFIEDDGDGYHMRKLGTVEVDGETYILWDASEYTEDYEITRAVSEDDEVGTELKGYDPETGEILDEGWSSSIASKFDVEGDGQGTILMLKDEYGNQCPYDFKSIQFKRWAVTDSQQGREGLDGKYMGVLNNVPTNISIEDEDDFIWAYTFSSDATGSEDQVDYSLDGTHWVYGNVLAMAPRCHERFERHCFLWRIQLRQPFWRQLLQKYIREQLQAKFVRERLPSQLVREQLLPKLIREQLSVQLIRERLLQQLIREQLPKQLIRERLL